MSLLPSPLKSPVPLAFHPASRLGVEVSPEASKVVPFMFHTAISPESWRHRMSLLPSPLKSPVPRIFHAASRLEVEVGPELPKVKPFIVQIAISPESWRS